MKFPEKVKTWSKVTHRGMWEGRYLCIPHIGLGLDVCWYPRERDNWWHMGGFDAAMTLGPIHVSVMWTRATPRDRVRQ